MAARESGTTAFWAGLLLGLLWGATLTWLYAPFSGRQLRTLVGEQVGELKGSLHDTVSELRDQAAHSFGQAALRGRDPLRGRVG